MKLSLLMTALALSPSAAAAMAYEESTSWGTEKDLPSVLADVVVREHVEEESPDYCRLPPPNPGCYRNDYPQCCVRDNQPCPSQKPRCDISNRRGDNYCTWSPDRKCYSSGRPRCCSRFRGTNCPRKKPDCDAENVEDAAELVNDSDSDSDEDSGLPSWEDAKKWGKEKANKAKKWGEGAHNDAKDWGKDAWRWGKDKGNSAKDRGRDARDKAREHWDRIKPPANEFASEDNERDGSDYCTWAPNYCFVDQWPRCCLNGNQPCPREQPRCDIMPPGGNYCTWSPEKSCYATGRPACCSRFGGSNCPKHRPRCDVESADNGLKVKTLRGAMGL